MGNLAGIDYGMKCPSITIKDVKDKSLFFHYYYNVKIHTGRKASNIFGVHTPEYSSEEERFDNISNWAISVLKKHQVTEVAIEGISFSSKGLIVQLGENFGLLKHKLWKAGIRYYTISPNTIKMVARNTLPEERRKSPDNPKHLLKMDKDVMVDTFFRETGIPLWDVFGLDKDKNPLQDIADSYFIMRALELELEI